MIFVKPVIRKINLCLLNDKKTLKKFGLRTWCTKEPFGYRVVHHSIKTVFVEKQINTVLFNINIVKIKLLKPDLIVIL